ncbi:MAG: DUF3667 domain-containing protein [Bdellovibrionales bacterium]
MICRYCQNQISKKDNFCRNCAESTSRKRLSVTTLFEGVLDSIFSLDKGFLFTIYTLFRDPNRLIRTYLKGGRRSFASPVKLYTTILFFSLLIFSTSPIFNFSEENAFDKGFHIGMTNTNSKSLSDTTENTKEGTSKDNVTVKVRSKKINKVYSKLKSNMKSILQVSFIIWIPISALFFLIYFPYRRFTYMENFSVSMYFSAAALLSLSLYELFNTIFKFQIDDFLKVPIFEPVMLLLYFYLVYSTFYRKKRLFFVRFLGFLFSSLTIYFASMFGLLLAFLYPYLDI